MNFTQPPNRQDYFEKVWRLVRKTPIGKVATYGQLSQMITAPQDISPEDYKAYSPRWVGDAMAACPDDVPWQRVINSQGKISGKSNAEKQRALLQQEGLVFVKDKLDLKTCQWGSPDQPEQTTLF